MGNIISIIIGGIIMGYFANCFWKLISEQKIKINDWKFHLQALITCLFQVTIFYFINNYIRVAIITIIFAILIKLFYKFEIRAAIALSITFQFLVFVSEFVFSIGISILLKGNAEIIVNNYIGSLLSNIIITLIAILIYRFININKIYIKLLSISNKIKMSNLVVIVLILIISLNIFLMTPFYKISTTAVVILNAVLLSVYSFILFKFIQEKNRYIEISDKHSLTESSLRELQSNINRLMTVNHENKNQLLTIRTMVANKDKNTLKNIDAIIDQKVKDDKYLKEKTSVISNTMLGALVYSKMLTMKDKKIKCSFHIDKQISKLEFINLGDKTNVDICKIIGTYLDNAIEAAVETKNKEVNIDIYLEDVEMIISISNTFKGKVELNRIHESGYTTKSSGHGYGLSLAREIIKNNHSLTSETEVLDNVFIQKLKIKM